MDIKIIDYSEKSIAVIGDSMAFYKPLKKLGGSWNRGLSCGPGWIFSAKKRAQVEAILNGEKPEITKKRDDKEFLDEYLAEIKKHWGTSSSMMDHFRKEFSSAVRLTNGQLLDFEKPRIETKFCFGYHTASPGSDFDEACAEQDKFMESVKPFLHENLAPFDNAIKKIETGHGDYEWQTLWLCISRRCWGDDALNLWQWHLCSPGDFDENVAHAAKYGGDYQRVSDEDREIILNGLKHEREKFFKRLETYLKRYGLTKIRTWTYWADE